MNEVPRCPKCGREVLHLVWTAWEFTKAKFLVKGRGIRYEVHSPITTNWKTARYLCPRCNTVLFDNEVDAEQFLKEGI